MDFMTKVNVGYQVVLFALAIVAKLYQLKAKKNEPPAWLAWWQKNVPATKIQGWIGEASTFAELSDDEKRALVRKKAQEWTLKEVGVPMPDSVADKLISDAFIVWKRVMRR